MPKSLISSIAEKAQAAVAGTPLAGKIPGTSATSDAATTPGNETQTATAGQQGYHAPTQEQSGTLGGRHYGLETIHQHLRTLQVQYSSGVSQENRQLQLLITASKGVALDFDATGRDAKSQSKELYLWGQTQGPDIKDVTDRLAYLNFVHGALSYTLATDLDKSRSSWKNVRDAEAALAPRRAARANITNQLNKVKTEGANTRVTELEAQLKKAQADDAPLENELELLKRTAIKESETLKWKALSEYAHKILLLAGASEQLLRVLPSSPPEQYTGHQQTAAVRAALQNALDSGYVPTTEHLPLNVGHGVPATGETRSFGETHASELSTITTLTDNGHDTHDDRRSSHDTATPINPAALNNAPAPIPVASGSGTHYNAPAAPPSGNHYAPPTAAPPPGSHGYAPPSNPPSSSSIPKGPTVAETGVPVSAGTEGPGPVAGNLHDNSTTDEHIPPYGGSVAIATAHESAEEEKRRLAAAAEQPASAVPAGLGVRQGGLVASTSTRRPATHESAEDEKKRLEREERERVLRGNQQREPTQDDGDDPSGGAAPPPAYQD